MQVRPEQLGHHLARGLRPVYLVTGDEPLQFNESLDAIRVAAREQGFNERTVPLAALARLDAMSKGAAPGGEWDGLRRLVLDFCGVHMRAV